MPTTYKEAVTLLVLSPENEKNISVNKTTNLDKVIKQSFEWVDDLFYERHHLKTIFSKENKNNETKKFEYITNLKINRENVEQIVNQGGRKRWGIENQGFKSQKKEEFALEHVYSMNINASKIFIICSRLHSSFSSSWYREACFKIFTSKLAV